MTKLPVFLLILIEKSLGKDLPAKEKPSKITPYQMPNGETVCNTDLPYLVGLYSHPARVSGIPQCSGILIKGTDYKHENGFVATSTLCLENNQVSHGWAVAIVGGVQCKVLHTFVMKNVPGMIDTDVAVFHISGCVSEASSAIPLVEIGTPPYQSNVNVSGWNLMADNPEIKVLDSEYILTKKECSQNFKGSGAVMDKESTFCFGEETEEGSYLCEAQSGSPVLSHGKRPHALGIASWTFESSDEKIYPCVAVDFSNEDVHKYLSHFINEKFSTLLGLPTLKNNPVGRRDALFGFPQ